MSSTMQLLSLPPPCASLRRSRASLRSTDTCFRASAALSRKSVPPSSPLTASSARVFPRSPRLLRTPYEGAAPSRGGSARARGKGDDPRERAEPVEAEIVGDDEWDQLRGRRMGSAMRGGSDMRGAQGGFDLYEGEMMRGKGAEELPPGWDIPDMIILEENVWASKPFWCQPWTILLTGAVAVGMSWAILHFIFLTLIVAAAIGVWWLTFLVAYPAAYKEMVQEEKRRRGM
ncbi:hypothetical protein CLOM_g1716 [Closterium sp. NIES-68]|nr:hypothetical protein CLOM_g1716 [Closterium sp. NIES-68]GJP69945.1 hypothetical protein CLOP_g939 [Closterium sp. NIES-67]